MKKESLLSNLKFDLPAGLVVFFVALPLCLGISLASTSYSGIDNMEDFTGIVIPGIISGIIGGIIVGSLSGSKFGVSGPAAGLITIVSAAIIQFGGFGNGGFEKFALAVALGGVIQFLLGVVKAGFVAYYIPFSVIKGMLAGIGITIFLKEIPHFFGYDKDPEGNLTSTDMDGHGIFEEIVLSLENVHWGATLVGVISIVLLVVWGIKAIKNNKYLSLIPGPLLAILISVAAATMLTGGLLIEGEHLVNVPSNFGEIQSDLMSPIYSKDSGFRLPDFTVLGDYNVWVVAITVALVASIESLLCVEATDKMDPNKGRTPLDKELRAQGVGNLISGLLGGLPITQVIVRSSANIGAGAKSKYSAIIHGVFLLVFIIAIPGLLNMIPRATLAAVLLLIGWKLASPKSMVQMVKAGWEQYVPFFVTILFMLVKYSYENELGEDILLYKGDLLKGVGAGIAVAFLIILYKNFQMSFFLKDGHNDGKIHLNMSQHTTFLNKASIMKTLDEIEDGKEVVIDLTETISIDYDVSEAIRDFVAGAEDRKIKVEIIKEEKLSQISMGH